MIGINNYQHIFEVGHVIHRDKVQIYYKNYVIP